MTITSSPADRSPRFAVGRVLTAVAATAALVSAVAAIADVAGAGADTRIVETWRMVGLAVFAGLFALLAARPHALPYLWELVLASKLALTVAALGYQAAGSATGTATIIAADGGLFVLLLAAYLCVRGWRAIRPPRGRAASA
ncbi:hypothetical protein Athai_05870 [Actinocatenispora thailandica]|uniref:Uncharacterized protein n=1 Tax=Actinocatenispora thailandica TaxID=227318 RepID=A0A7R7DK01_9ACTN|nr:hypothetical protein [Actinocatenispora thailandica]BCJ33084.1 hypothetical protein Athai_05870 [Actinocatenispora thailandica]